MLEQSFPALVRYSDAEYVEAAEGLDKRVCPVCGKSVTAENEIASSDEEVRAIRFVHCADITCRAAWTEKYTPSKPHKLLGFRDCWIETPSQAVFARKGQDHEAFWAYLNNLAKVAHVYAYADYIKAQVDDSAKT